MTVERMTSRQRVIAALEGRPVDRVPWIPLCSWTYFASLPEYQQRFIADGRQAVKPELHEQALAFRVAFYREVIHADFMQWCANGGVSRRPDRVRVESISDGDIARARYRTPKGELTMARLWSEEARTSFPIEDLIKTPADLEAYEYVVRDEVIEAAYAGMARDLAVVGEDGVLFCSSPPAPLKDLLLGEMRLEHAAYALEEDRAQVERLFAAMHERNLRIVRLQAQSPARIFLDAAVTGLGMASPRWVREFYTPYSREYAEVYRQAGKIHLHHASGEPVLAIAQSIADSRIHALYGLAWPPRGECRISSVRAAIGPHIALSGGIEPSLLAAANEDQIRARTHEVLRDMAGQPGFLLGTADDVPWGTPPSLLAAAGRVVSGL